MRADFRSENARHRYLLGRNDAHVETTGAQRRRHLKADEARADHGHAADPGAGRDETVGVGERAQIMNVAPFGSRRRQLYGKSARREKQRVVRQRRPVSERQPLARGIERLDAPPET